MKIVKVEWIDSGESRGNGWEPMDKLMKLGRLEDNPVTTIGFLMHTDKDQIVIGQSYDKGNDLWYSVQVIWQKAILKVETLHA